jgi:hypothetical protein
MIHFDRRKFLSRSVAAGVAVTAPATWHDAGAVASAGQVAGTRPAELPRQWIAELSERLYGLRLSDADAGAVTALTNALRVESQRALAMPVEQVEPATVFRPRNST